MSEQKKANLPIFIYLSQLMDKPVFDKNGDRAGTFYDVVVRGTEVYPSSSHLVVRKGLINRKYAVVPWSEIAQFDAREISLRIEQEKLVFSEKQNNKEALTLRRDILDQQVVDTQDHKVIRVNDIHLLFVDSALMVAHVDISTRGLLRRLGFEKAVDFLVKLFSRDAAYLHKENLLSWKYIHPLSINPVSMTIKVDIPQKKLNSIPAADLGEIFLDLDMKQKVALFKSLDIYSRSRIFIHIDFKTQKDIIDELKPKEIADILSTIPSDEATDFLEKLPKTTVDKFLTLVETKKSGKLSQLLGYSSDSAGGLMTTDYLSFLKDTTIESALNQIRERSFKSEPAQFVYIVDEANRLVGCTNFRVLITTNLSDPILKAAFPKTYSVHLDSTVKEVAYLMEKYKYYTIPVVDAEGLLQGIITVDDILSQVIAIAWRRFSKMKNSPKI